MRFSKLLGLAIALAATAGCSQDNTGPVKVYPVRGQILYDGKPLAGVRVRLIPTDAPSPPRIPDFAHGTTDAEGKFQLSTYAENDGAPAGGYQVVLDGSQVVLPDAKPAAEGVGERETSGHTDVFKGWYDLMHSTLTVRIKPQDNDVPPFKIPKITREAGVSEGIPDRN